MTFSVPVSKQDEPTRQGLVYKIMVLVGFGFNPFMTNGISHKDIYNKVRIVD